MSTTDIKKKQNDKSSNIDFITNDVKEIKKDGKIISIKIQNRNFAKKLTIVSAILIILGISLLIYVV